MSSNGVDRRVSEGAKNTAVKLNSYSVGKFMVWNKVFNFYVGLTFGGKDFKPEYNDFFECS